MRHLKVPDSDTIEAIGFEETEIRNVGTIGAMEVVFKSSPDTIYRYDNVNALLFVHIVGSNSIGSAFHESFKKTNRPFTKSQRPPTLKK